MQLQSYSHPQVSMVAQQRFFHRELCIKPSNKFLINRNLQPFLQPVIMSEQEQNKYGDAVYTDILCKEKNVEVLLLKKQLSLICC